MKTTSKYGKANLCALLATLAKGKPLPIAPVMMPVSTDAGSRFGEDVIRITGSDEFCQAVLSRLADLIEVERSNHLRLDCSWSEVKDGDRFKKGCGGNSIYLRMAKRSTNDSPMAVSHRAARIHF